MQKQSIMKSINEIIRIDYQMIIKILNKFMFMKGESSLLIFFLIYE